MPARSTPSRRAAHRTIARATPPASPLDERVAAMRAFNRLYTRKLVQRAATIPADKYADVRAFFGRVRASEESPVVLARK